MCIRDHGNTLILHEVQSNMIIFSGDVQGEMALRVDLLLRW